MRVVLTLATLATLAAASEEKGCKVDEPTSMVQMQTSPGRPGGLEADNLLSLSTTSYFQQLSLDMQSIALQRFGASDNDICIPEEMKSHVRNETTTDVSRLLRDRKPVSFIRIGDGDVFCLNGAHGGNLEGIRYFEHKSECEDLGRELSTLGAKDDSNMYVLVGTFFLCHSVGQEFNGFLKRYPPHPKFKGFLPRGFYVDLDGQSIDNTTPVAPPSGPSTMGLLKDRKVVVLGPNHLRTLTTSLNIASFIDGSNAADHIEEILAEIKKESAKWPDENVIFLVSAGFAGRLLILKSFASLGQKDSFIDTGACLDGLAGVPSREFNTRDRVCLRRPQFAAEGICECQGPGMQKCHPNHAK